MKILKIVFFQILLFHSFIFPFRFFSDQKIYTDFFWHLKILNTPKSSLQFVKSQKKVQIAILDTFFYENQKLIDFYHSNLFNLATNQKCWPNLTKEEKYCQAKERLGGGENDSLNLKIDRQFLSEFFKKNHGAFVVSLIRQCAPKIEIISIPIFNDQGTTSLEKLLDGLRNALQQNVDILYLGLKVEDNNFLIQKKEILNLLQQFSYVVAPSGNDGLISFTVAFPANSIFFSVGAFEKKNNQYLICDFSQKQIKNGPNFVMPGKNLGCFLWNDQNQKIENYLVSGTSAAAACMVGCLALILYENQQNFTPQQIQYLIQKNSKKLNLCFKNDQSKFGLINTLGCLSCIQQLKVFQKQMSKKKFQKNFKKLVEKVVKMQNEII